jgi:methyl-accepting chemotaxis protein
MWLLPAMTAMIVVVGIAINSRLATQTSDALHKLEDIQYPAVETIRSLRMTVDRIQESLQQAVAEGDRDALGKANELAEASRRDITSLNKLLPDIRGLDAAFSQYYSSATTATRLFLGVDKGDASAAVPQMQASSKALNDLLATLEDSTRKDLQALIDSGTTNVSRTLNVSIISAILMLVALGAGSMVLIRSVMVRLGGEPEDAANTARRIAEGDFTAHVNVVGNDRESLLYSMSQLRERLGTLIRNVHKSSRAVDVAATEMSESIEKLNGRTQQQAASLEETAASMEQMTATVRASADNARNADKLAVNARKQAETGGTVVGQAIEAMSAIRTSSNKIANIIGVIDEIAFQTNLLALNAAVEAARAGEQGRGFAVVASEVRNLAQRSASAAREIKQLIADSTDKVQDGTRLVDESGKHLRDIVDSVKKMADIIGQISTASSEQARGIEQVNDTVTQLDQVTQGNSAMSDQARSVARAMTAQATELLQIVSVFRVAESSMSESTTGSIAPSSGVRAAGAVRQAA